MEVIMRATLLLVPLLLLVGCGQQAEVDLAAEQQMVLAADKEFAAQTLERGGDGWADFFAQDAIIRSQRDELSSLSISSVEGVIPQARLPPLSK